MESQLKKTLKWISLLLVGCCLIVLLSYETVPTTDTDATKFDTIIVLGSPADPDGQSSSEQRERVYAAMREIRAGRSRHLILTGGPTFGGSTESQVMATIALEAGIPKDSLVIEPQARNTIENVYYSHQIMQSRGWQSAEVVSSPSHIPRAGLILEYYSMPWATHAARWPPEYDWRRIAARYLHEAIGTTILRWFGFARSPYLPEH